MAAVFVLAPAGFQSTFAVDIITMRGLGLGIDDSLFIVARFREEIRRRPVEDAIAISMAIVGKAIRVSGVTVVFGAVMVADVVIIKSMGIGLALAVLLDATIVRGLLVPATLRLMGRWNWWTPAGAGALWARVVAQLGMGHAGQAPGACSPRVILHGASASDRFPGGNARSGRRRPRIRRAGSSPGCRSCSASIP